MQSSWKAAIFAGLFASGGCVDARGISGTPGGLVEHFAYPGIPQIQARPHIGGTPASGAFLVDFTKGYDSSTQSLSDWVMDAAWLKADFSPHNVRFDRNGMTLSITHRNGGPTPYVSAEFQRVGFYGYGRYEVVMKAAKMPGIVSSFFTHTDAYFGDPHSEIDFEFVGGKPHEVHTNYFGDGRSEGLDIELGFDASEDFHIYAFEWVPDRISWYVDGVEIRTVEAEDVRPPIPSVTSRVMANIWAANNQALEWVGAPKGAGAQAVYRCMSHVPMGETGISCSDVSGRLAR